MNKIINFSPFDKWVVIPTALLAFWLAASLLSSNYGFTTLVDYYGKDNFTRYSNSELLAGQKVSATFQSQEDHLGIVAVRFHTFSRDNDDWLIFRIREKGSKDWYYQNKYKVDQFQPDQLFTFGFPIIDNSKGKTYQFEIESTRGVLENSVTISPKWPIFVVEYHYTRQELMADKGVLINFLVSKLHNHFSKVETLANSSVYLLPFLIYLGYFILRNQRAIRQHADIYSNRVKVAENNYILTVVYSLLLLLLILFTTQTEVLGKFLMLGGWLAIIRIYGFDDKASFLYALITLAACPVLLISGLKTAAENAAIWAFYFLLFGTIQAAWETWNLHIYWLKWGLFYKRIIKVFSKTH